MNSFDNEGNISNSFFITIDSILNEQNKESNLIFVFKENYAVENKQEDDEFKIEKILIKPKDSKLNYKKLYNQ